MLATRLEEVDAQEGQLLRILVRQRPQQHAVDDAEDGGVGPDAQGEGENHDGNGEARLS